MIAGWAIYPMQREGQENAFQWMIDSARESDIDLKIMFAEDFSVVIDGGVVIYHKGIAVTPPSFVLFRHYDNNLSTALEMCGTRLFNSSMGMNNARDKFITHCLLVENNIPTPMTLYQCTEYNEAIMHLGQPFIFKSTIGSKGEEVFLINSEEEFMDCVTRHPNYILQKYIKASRGRDIRVWVVGDRCVAVTMRENKNSFKSNIALGGIAIPYSSTPQLERLAIKSCKALSVELAGVDILIDGDGEYIVCEVNANAGFRAFSQYEERIDIPKQIFKYIGNIP